MGHARAVRIAIAVIGLGLLGGCSAQSKAPATAGAEAGGAEEAPAYGQSRIGSGDAEPEDELARAEAEIDELFGKEGQAGDTPGGEAEARPLSEGDRCELACRALGTMRRAAERVCGLAPGGQRCDGVKTRTARAQERVRGACPGCTEL